MIVRISIIALLVVGLSAAGAVAQPDSLWSKTFGSSGQDSLWDMIPTMDGGWALVGYTTMADERGMDLLQIKLDSDCNEQWTHQVDFGNANDEAHGIVQTPDGGYFIVGYTSSAPTNQTRAGVVMKTDGQGAVLWTHFIDDHDYTDVYSAVVRPNGDLAAGGTLYPGNDWQDDFAMWYATAAGHPVWEQHYGQANRGEWGLSLINTSDGGLLLAGQALQFNQNHGIDSCFAMVVKSDTTGTAQWSHYYGEDNSISWALQAIQTSDGGYAFVGATGVSTHDQGITNWDAWLVKTDAQGAVQWSRKFDDGKDEWGMGLVQVADGGFVLVGVVGDNVGMEMTNADGYMVRVDAQGNMQWHRRFCGSNHEFAMKVFPTHDGGYLIGGTTASIGAGACDFWVLKTGPDPLSVEKPGFILHPSSFVLSAYPNPFNSTTTISYDVARPGFIRLGVYDVGGKLVETLRNGYSMPGRYSTAWRGIGTASGEYFLKLTGGNGSEITHGILLQK